MSKALGKYKSEYQDIIYLELNNKNDIYTAYNKKDKRDVTLKIINKEIFKDINLLREKLNKEIEIVNQCKSDNILDIYKILDTESNFILEQEFYETNMHEYITDNGPLSMNKNFFKQIAKEMAKALKIIHDRKIIHRKIKSSSIFLKDKNGKYQIKLGNFFEAIYTKNNKSEPLDSFYYTAPEIINGDKYDEKSDLWSIGITLYDMYFGDLPYGYKPSKMKIIKALSSKDNFHYEKSNIPILDYIFDGLLKLNPKERMSYEELFDIIFNYDFMDKNAKYIKKIIEEKKNNTNKEEINDSPLILKENQNIESNNKNELILRENKNKEINNQNKIVNPSLILKESKNKESINENEINNISSENKINEINNQEKVKSLSESKNIEFNQEKEINIKYIEIKKNNNQKEKYNNIIYYDEDKANNELLYKICNYFEQETPGAFIFCPNFESFKIIKEEIKKEKKNNNKIVFNLITKRRSFPKINDIISKDNEFAKCIEHKCIYCHKPIKYEIFGGENINICNHKGEAVDFIHETSNEKISPYKINDLITYDKFSKKYHSKFDEIIKYLSNLNKENDKKYFNELEKFIKNKKENELEMKKNVLLNGFYNISNDNFLNVFIKNHLYKDLNNFIGNDLIIEECIAFITGRVMNLFLDYSSINKKKYNWKKDKIYMGINLKLSELLQFERVKGSIQFPNFIIFYEKKELAEKFANRKQSIQYYKDNLKFSVIFILTKKKKYYDGINIEDFMKEKAILFLPFDRLELKNIVFDFSNFTADIYLE